MEYYKFAHNTKTYTKFKELNNSNKQELESVYAFVRPLGAVGLYQTTDMVLGAIFIKDSPENSFIEDQWDLAREVDDKVIYIPNSKYPHHEDVQITITQTDELLKKELFNSESSAYFTFVLTDKWLVVETTDVLLDFKANKCPRAFFKKICDRYKKEKNMKILG